MSHKNHIEGILRLSTPMHCTMPGDKIKDATPTMQIGIVTGTGRDNMPYFPGNDLRGRLRRKAAAIVMPALVSEGGKLPLELYAGLTCGASDTSPENELSIEEALRSAKNIYMGVFGGGKRLLRSRFSVQDLIPITQSTVDTGLVPKKYEIPDPEKGGTLVDYAWKLLEILTSYHRDDVHNVSRPEEMMNYMENCEVTVAEYQENNLQNARTRKEEKADGVTGKDKERTRKTGLNNIMPIQVIQAGTPMYFRMDFHDGVTDAQIGLMLQSLEALVNEQALGGWSRIGLGKYHVREMNLVRDGESMPVFTGGDGDAFRLHNSLATYVRQAQEEVAALTVADMVSYFKPSKSD